MRNVRRRYTARLARPEGGAQACWPVSIAIRLVSLICYGMPRVEQIDANAARRGAQREAYQGATIQSVG